MPLTSPLAPGDPLLLHPRKPVQWLLLNLALALMFGLAARLGLALAIGPAQTTTLWPAAGVAVAALLLWGWPVLPGLLLASVGNDWWVARGSPGALLAASLLSAAALAQWALLKLLLGDWWARMQAGGGRWALRFVVLVSMGCVLATSLGNAALLAQGRLAAGDLAQAWLTWWVGDCAGILVVSPLILMLLHRGVRAHCVANQAFPVLALGIGLSLTGSFTVGQLERETALAGKRADLRLLAQSLQSQMKLAEVGVARLADLHFRVTLSDAEFDAAGRELRNSQHWIRNLAYLRRVPHAERAALEAELGQHIASPGPDGRLGVAPEQSSYWVVVRLNPYGGQEARLGLDEGSDPPRRAVIDRALATRRPALSPVLRNLHYAENEELAVLLAVPTFERGNTAQASGLVEAGLPLVPLLEAALAQFPEWRDPLLLLSDDAAPAGLLQQGGEMQELHGEGAQTVLQGWLRQSHLQQAVHFGDHHWLLRTQPPELNLRPSALQLLTLAAGLAFSGLLSAFLAARTRRDQALARWQAELEVQVGERTRDLEHANAQLREEVVERQRMADQLRLSSEQLMHQTAQLHTLLKFLPDLAWLKDVNGRYTLVNPALERFLGRSADELLGHEAQEFLDSSILDHAAELDASAALLSTPLETEVELVDAKGRTRIHSVTRVAIRDAQGQRIGLLGVARDITQRREREALLQRFRWLADSAAQGFAFADLQGQLVYLNHTARRWLNDEDWQEGQPRHARDYLAEDARQRLREEIWPQVQAQGHWNGLLPLRGRPGAQPPELHSSLFLMRDDQGQARYVALVMTDLSERLRLERDLDEARQRAESANRAKSAFLANMSHEIRTPLNAVLGYAQLLREDTRLSSGVRERVESIYNAGARLLRLINDVLDLSKIEAGALQLNAERVDLCREIEESVRLLQERARSSGLGLTLSLELPRPLHVLIDRGKFGQVLLNLLGNALKFTVQGGVSVSARLDDAGALDLRVQDSGAGMDEAELNQLFSPFVQGQAGQLRGGTGLGLSLSRSLVRAMGGELSLSSRKGEGSCARIQLPLERCSAAELQSEPASAPPSRLRLRPGSRCRVLVVEDDPDSRELLVALLLQMGCQVRAAEHGAQALERLREEPVELILTDMRMPVMDGVALRQHLAAHAHWSHIPMVAVTASSLLHEREAFIAMGFADFIAKPFDFSQIQLMLQTHAGAELVPAPGPEGNGSAAQAAPAADAAPSPLPADWPQALAWAQAGRAVELREWVQAQPESPLRRDLLTALARYDLQAAEALLQTHCGGAAAEPETPA